MMCRITKRITIGSSFETSNAERLSPKNVWIGAEEGT